MRYEAGEMDEAEAAAYEEMCRKNRRNAIVGGQKNAERLRGLKARETEQWANEDRGQ